VRSDTIECALLHLYRLNCLFELGTEPGLIFRWLEENDWILYTTSAIPTIFLKDRFTQEDVGIRYWNLYKEASKELGNKEAAARAISHQLTSEQIPENEKDKLRMELANEYETNKNIEDSITIWKVLEKSNDEGIKARAEMKLQELSKTVRTQSEFNSQASNTSKGMNFIKFVPASIEKLSEDKPSKHLQEGTGAAKPKEPRNLTAKGSTSKKTGLAVLPSENVKQVDSRTPNTSQKKRPDLAFPSRGSSDNKSGKNSVTRNIQFKPDSKSDENQNISNIKARIEGPTERRLLLELVEDSISKSNSAVKQQGTNSKPSSVKKQTGQKSDSKLIFNEIRIDVKEFETESAPEVEQGENEELVESINRFLAKIQNLTEGNKYDKAEGFLSKFKYILGESELTEDKIPHQILFKQFLDARLLAHKGKLRAAQASLEEIIKKLSNSKLPNKLMNIGLVYDDLVNCLKAQHLLIEALSRCLDYLKNHHSAKGQWTQQILFKLFGVIESINTLEYNEVGKKKLEITLDNQSIVLSVLLSLKKINFENVKMTEGIIQDKILECLLVLFSASLVNDNVTEA
jgi:hypothetical protein